MRRTASPNSLPRAAPPPPLQPLRPGRAPKYAHAATAAFVSGFNEIILISAVLSFIGATLGFFLVRSRHFVQATSSEAQPAAEPAPA